MMKLYIILPFLLVTLAAILAVPIEDEYKDLLEENIAEISDIRNSKNKLLLCQKSGKIGEWIEDTACYARCVFLGKQFGGYCYRGTCYCRSRIM
uniref:defensin-1-like isoform X1 n=1 Tax=Vespula vulgaris TaxID=7454 RepID=UPI00212E00D3|nr:defensin-1-like isoform X1 [Vespula vulgaris]